jgi:hypothetical protein
MKTIIIVLFVLPILCVGGIWLQIFLSRKESRVLGLLLPALCFLFSLVTLLNVAVTETMTAWEVFSVLAVAFLLSNIPTLILLAIYFACREKRRRKKLLEKMNIQDLD